MYAAWHRIDWEAQRMARSWALPTTTLEAERLHSTVAPACAPADEGGTAVQKSSQISTWNVKSGKPEAVKRRSVPNGNAWPAIVASRPRRPTPGENQRLS